MIRKCPGIVEPGAPPKHHHPSKSGQTLVCLVGFPRLIPPHANGGICHIKHALTGNSFSSA